MSPYVLDFAAIGRDDVPLAVEGCRRHGIHSGICGQAPSDHPDMAEFLVRSASTR